MNVFAQQTVDIGTSYGSPWGISLTLSDLVSIIISLGITFAGIIVVFLFIFAGYGIIAGAGNNDPKAAAQGRQALTYALMGFIIVFTSYMIIRFIELVLGVDFFTNPLAGGGGGPLPPGGPVLVP